jgi:hypothetical protein
VSRVVVALVAFAAGAAIGWIANVGPGDTVGPADRARLEEDLTSARHEADRLREELQAARMEDAKKTYEKGIALFPGDERLKKAVGE